MEGQENVSTTSKKLLSLDLSVSCTGYAVFCLETHNLLRYGTVSPSTKGLSKWTYPFLPILKIRRLVEEILVLIQEIDPEIILIEEINRGVSRLSQKTLDAAHFMLLDKLPEKYWNSVRYYDSDGSHGWRSKNGLGLLLSDLDKIRNKEIRALNKKLDKDQKKFIPITQKTLCCRMMSKLYGLELDENQKGHNDIADALGLGTFYLMKVLNGKLRNQN